MMTKNDQMGQPSGLGFGKMSEADFQRFIAFIYDVCGIKLDAGKQVMLEGRLAKRMRALGIRSFRDYTEFFFSPEGQNDELPHMIDVVTTNKTDFFREPDHFKYLVEKGIPQLLKERVSGDHRRFLVWSAGCSSGEEPYTLSMVLTDFRDKNPGFDFLILATDISNTILEQARSGIYEEPKVAPVPAAMKSRFLLRSKDRTQKVVRVVPQLRQKIKFAWLNLMEEFNIKESFDVIFCRNVIIYFDRPTQEKLIGRYYRQLIPGGLLLLGHSETLTGMNLPFTQVAPTVYRKPK